MTYLFHSRPFGIKQTKKHTCVILAVVLHSYVGPEQIKLQSLKCGTPNVAVKKIQIKNYFSIFGI